MEPKRIETDSMGSIQVPADRYWGAQTQRALVHFAIGRERMPIEVIHAIALIKQVAAIVNQSLGVLGQRESELIVAAAAEVAAGQFDDHFPLPVWISGSGTQCNMNVNEVIANLAIERSGGVLGSRSPIHPNDHVNRSQSSNDVFPSAISVAAAQLLHDRLLPALEMLRLALDVKKNEWQAVVKVGRTHLQDAVPITLGQEVSGWVANLDAHGRRLRTALDELLPLALGGTAVGTGLNAPADFAARAAERLAEMTGLPFITAPNKFAVQGSHDALLAASAALRGLAVFLHKMANDIRLLACGPRAGLNELLLPANEPGSSIMPGKVNPTQCEALTMVCMQVIGLDQANALANAGGQLEMNAYKPLLAFNLVTQLTLLSDACLSFKHHLVEGMQPNLPVLETQVRGSLMLATVLVPILGYDRTAELTHYADTHGCSLEDANRALAILPVEELRRLLDPTALV